MKRNNHSDFRPSPKRGIISKSIGTSRRRGIACKETGPSVHKQSNALSSHESEQNVPKTVMGSIMSKMQGIDQDSLRKLVKMREQGLSLAFIARYRQSEIKDISEPKLREVEMNFNSAVELESAKGRALGIVSTHIESDMIDTAMFEIENCVSIRDVDMIICKYKSQESHTYVSKLRNAFKNVEALTLATHVKQCSENTCANLIEESPNLQDAIFLIAASIFADRDCLEIGRNVVRRGCADVRYFRPHQWLALRREKGSIDKSFFQFESSVLSDLIFSLYRALVPSSASIQFISGATKITKNTCLDILIKAISVAVTTFLIPQFRKEFLEELNRRADEEALENFALNIKHKLLQPGVSVSPSALIFGIDPGITSGCKCVVYAMSSGSVADRFTFKFNQRDAVSFSEFMNRYCPELIVAGDGTGSGELLKFLSKLFPAVRVCVVSESGASKYSISELAMSEFPGLSVEYRGCVSLVRRALDPLSELTKIEPQHLSVGIYQHDIQKNLLTRYLKLAVTECVAAVGVDANTATVGILALVPALDYPKARSIVHFRDRYRASRFTNRFDLATVPGLDSLSWKNAIGFIRVRDSNLTPLDSTAVHPEMYCIANAVVRTTPEFSNLYSPHIPPPLLSVIPNDTEEEVLRLLRLSDPRDDEPSILIKQAREWVNDSSKAIVGKSFYGFVQTVTPFGAFVSLKGLGIPADGLLHISKYPHGVTDPHYYAANQEVYVTVDSVSAEGSGKVRISLIAGIH